MLATAFTQVRYAATLVRGGRISVTDLHRLIADTARTRDEFGSVGDEQRELMTGTPLDPDVRELIDTKRLRKAATVAAATPYYRALFAQLGLDVETLSAGDLVGWPVTPKAALRALPEAFVRADSKPTVHVQTTGTTGRPTAIWLSDYEAELMGALSAVSLMYTQGIDDTDVLHLAICSRASVAVLAMSRAARLIGAVCTIGGVVDPAYTLARLTQRVRLPGKKPKPSLLDTYPSYLAQLLQTATELGYRRSDFELDWIFCAGEVLTDALARRAEEFFGARIVDMYAMTETVPVAGMACDQGHLHWSPEQGLVELLDPETLSPARPGALATLVVTPYPPYRETTQLFRLNTGDLVRRLDGGPLDCSLARMPASSRLLGKAALATTQGGRLLTTRDVLDVLEAEPAVPLPARYAVVPSTTGAELHVLAPGAGPPLRERLEGRIADAGLPIDRLVLHDDRQAMPATAPLRADLVERSFADPAGSAGPPMQGGHSGGPALRPTPAPVVSA